MNYTSSAVDKVSNEITAMDAAELISERYSDCEFALNVNMFHYHQDKDKVMLKQIPKEIKKNPNSTLYTTKEVEYTCAKNTPRKSNELVLLHTSTSQMRLHGG